MRRRPMSPIVPLAVLLLVLVGALFFLSSRAKEQPTQMIVVDVANAPAAR